MPWPWTDDPILQAYRFCNVRRRHDRTSCWIRERVIAPHQAEPTLHMFLAFCRFINWPDAICEVMDAHLWPAQPPHWRLLGDVIDQRVKRREQAWGAAFMVRGERTSSRVPWASWGKGRYVAEIVVEREFSNHGDALRKAMQEQTREAVTLVMAKWYGWAGFMAGQVVDDWTWTPLLADATDHFTWAPLGPGSQRGLNRLRGLPLTHKDKQGEGVVLMREIRKRVVGELGPAFHDLALMDIQNCLCEYDKYERVRLGQGRPRSRYHVPMPA